MLFKEFRATISKLTSVDASSVKSIDVDGMLTSFSFNSGTFHSNLIFLFWLFYLITYYFKEVGKKFLLGCGSFIQKSRVLRKSRTVKQVTQNRL